MPELTRTERRRASLFMESLELCQHAGNPYGGSGARHLYVQKLVRAGQTNKRQRQQTHMGQQQSISFGEGAGNAEVLNTICLMYTSSVCRAIRAPSIHGSWFTRKRTLESYLSTVNGTVISSVWAGRQSRSLHDW